MRHKITIISFIITIALVLVGWYLDHEQLTEQITLLQNQQSSLPHTGLNNKSGNPYLNMDLAVVAIPSQEDTWGYKITAGGRIIIKQTNIPGFPGNLGFKYKKNALTTGELVLTKIKGGEFPPSVTIEELNRLGVID